MTDDPNVHEDLAPDADAPGDDQLPEELSGLIHEGDIVPDNVDQKEEV